MGGDADIVALGLNYTRIFLLFTPFFMCNYIFSAFVRNDGDPSLAMVATLSGSLFNVVFDYIFIFPMGLGLPGRGAGNGHLAGAQHRHLPPLLKEQHAHLCPAGPLGPAAGAELPAGHLRLCRGAFLCRDHHRVQLPAAPAGGQRGRGRLRRGGKLCAGGSSHLQWRGQGAQPLISQCYGKNEMTGAKKLLLLGCGTALALAAVLYSAVFGFTDTFVALFNSESSALMAEYAHSGMRIYFLGYFFAGCNIVAGYLGAVNRPTEATITSVSRGVAAIVTCSLILSALFGMNGVWSAFPAAEAITLALTVFLLKRPQSVCG